MKALKSSLAKKLIADPVARKEFRSFLVNHSSDSKTRQIKIATKGETLSVTPKVVLRTA